MPHLPPLQLLETYYLGSLWGRAKLEDSAKWVAGAVGEDQTTSVSTGRQGHAAKSLRRNRDSMARTIITVDRGRPPDQPGGARVIARA